MESHSPTIELRKVRRNNISGEKFDSFDVWIDKKLYCTTRYRDFGTFSESIANEFAGNELPTFPPKKMNMSFFALNEEDLQERRQSLEAYMQKAFQIPKFHESPLVKRFFYEERRLCLHLNNNGEDLQHRFFSHNSTQQREWFLETFAKDVEEKVYLPDDTSVVLKIKTSIRSEDLLKLVMDTMQMSTKHATDFALFEVPDDTSRPEVKLSPHIHPWLSTRGLEFTSAGLDTKGFLYDELIPSDHKPVAKIFIKKWVFTPQRLTDMFKDPLALKIVFAQAQTDLKNKLIFPTADERADLRKLALEGNAKEYMRLIRGCRGFGVTYMAPCKCNYPSENSRIMLGVSVEGLEFHYITGEKRTGEEEVHLFAWEKIKRWKYSEPDKTFSFQYFFKPNQDTWMICETEQFFVINSVIQEYIEELKRKMRSAGHTFTDQPPEEQEKESGKEKEKEADKTKAPTPATSVATPAPAETKQTKPSKPEFENSTTSSLFSSKLSQLSLKGPSSKKTTENNTFNPTITDDDL